MFLFAFLVSGLCAFGRRTFSRAFCCKIIFGDRRRQRPVDVRQAVDGEAIVALIGDGYVSLAALFVGITGDRIGRAEITGRVGLPRNDRAGFDLLLQRLVVLVFKIDQRRVAEKSLITAVTRPASRVESGQVGVENFRIAQIEDLNMPDALVYCEEVIAGRRQSFDRAGEDFLPSGFARRVGDRADALAFVLAGLPIEDLDHGVLFAGDEEIAVGFVNRDAFATVEVGVSGYARLLELPTGIDRSVGVEPAHVIQVRVNGVNATARINGDTSELVEALLAEPRALEFIIIWAELFAIDAHCSRVGGNKRVSEVERLIGNKRYSGRRYRNVDNLAAEDAVTELVQIRFGFDVPDLHAPIFCVGGEQPAVRREGHAVGLVEIGGAFAGTPAAENGVGLDFDAPYGSRRIFFRGGLSRRRRLLLVRIFVRSGFRFGCGRRTAGLLFLLRRRAQREDETRRRRKGCEDRKGFRSHIGASVPASPKERDAARRECGTNGNSGLLRVKV